METIKIDDVINNCLVLVGTSSLEEFINNASDEKIEAILMDHDYSHCPVIGSSYLVLDEKLMCAWCGAEMIPHFSNNENSVHYNCSSNCKGSNDERDTQNKILESRAWEKLVIKKRDKEIMSAAKKVSKPFFIKEINSILRTQHNLKHQFQKIQDGNNE
jgi:hypothetical protein